MAQSSHHTKRWRAVSTNSCSNCLSTFASRLSAINNLIRAYTIGHCPRNRSAHSHISHGETRHFCAGFATSGAQTSGSISYTFAPAYRTHDQSSRLSGAENTWLFARLMQTDSAAASNTGSGWQLAITTVAGARSSVGPSNKKQRTDDQTSTDAAASQKLKGKRQGREGEATPPSHGRSGPGIDRTTHVAGCSTAPNLGGVTAGHLCCQPHLRSPFQ